MQAARHLGRPDRLGPGAPDRGGRRHRRSRNGATSPGQAAHLPTRSAGRCRRPGRWPWRVAHPHVPGPDHARPGSGVPAAAVFLAETLGKDLQAPAPSWPPTPGSLPSHAAPAHRSVVSTSPTAATRGSNAPCSPPPSPHCAPTPSARPTTSANATKANRLEPGRPRPGPPPHPDPARHDPQQHPLHPPTSHETTHRRLTHHIGARYRPGSARLVTGRCCP